MTTIAGIDIETTGLKQEEGHRIIEICMSLYNLEEKRKIGTYTQRINPQRSIQAAAQAVHGITINDLIGCPEWESVAPKVQKILSKCDTVVAHNGDWFDIPFIVLELIRAGQEIPKVNSFDTMTNARWATPMGKNPSLKELCFALDIDYDPSQAHGAEYDVDVMMQCLFEGIDRGFYKVETKEEKVAA